MNREQNFSGLRTMKKVAYLGIISCLIVGMSQVKPTQGRHISDKSDSRSGDRLLTNQGLSSGSGGRLLTNQGLSLKEVAAIRTRLTLLKESRRNMTSQGKTWLDNLLPHLEDTYNLLEGCSWMTSHQLDYLIHMVRVKLADIREQERDIARNGMDTNGKEREDSLEIKTEKAKGRRKRKIEDFSKMPNLKWQNPIFYKFDGMHSKSEQGVIRAAIRHWEQHTCIRFFEVNLQARVPFAHLIFTKTYRGCLSFIGQVEDDGQLLNLHTICLAKFGIPVHEIGHALGLWHEHQRWDRDDYLQVVDDNLGPRYQSQFWRHATETYGLPYDYGSVMHYAAKAGSVTGGVTLETLDPLYQSSLGQRTGLSFYDAKAVNIAYCSESCRRPLPRRCERGGYQDPTDCSRCRCSQGAGGRFCTTVAPSTPGCGGIVEVTTEGTTVTSPGYNVPGYYDDHTQCNWLIKAPRQHRVRVIFEGEFGIYCDSQETCYHWVEIVYKGDLSLPGPRLCCATLPAVSLLSEGREVLLAFSSNFTTYWRAARRGFKVKVMAELMLDVGESHEIQISQEQLVTDRPGMSWSEWGRCQNSECKCGGCSISTRHNMCGYQRCLGSLARTETRSCDRLCTLDDTYLNLSGNITEIPCPVCCEGFVPERDVCLASES